MDFRDQTFTGTVLIRKGEKFDEILSMLGNKQSWFPLCCSGIHDSSIAFLRRALVARSIHHGQHGWKRR